MHRRQTRTSSRGDENFPRKWAECDMGRDIYHWEHGIKCPTYFRASLQRLSKASTVFDPPGNRLLFLFNFYRNYGLPNFEVHFKYTVHNKRSLGNIYWINVLMCFPSCQQFSCLCITMIWYICGFLQFCISCLIIFIIRHQDVEWYFYEK